MDYPLVTYKTWQQAKFFVENAGNIPMDQGMLYKLIPSIVESALIYLNPVFLIVFIAVIASSYFQHGQFVFSDESLILELSKISIIKGFSRIFSMKRFVEFLKGIFKIILIEAFVLLVILADVKELSQYQELSIDGILGQLFIMIKDIIILVTIVMAVTAVLDFSYQNYQRFKELKMTKHEAKEGANRRKEIQK